jgi:hypothetical protein
VDGGLSLRSHNCLPLSRGNIKAVYLPFGGTAVFSPHLLNFFVHDFPADTQLNLSYAENFHLSESLPDIVSLGRKLTEHLNTILLWCKDNKMSFASEKSYVTLLSPNSREMNCDLGVFLGDQPIPVDKGPKWLGFTFTNMGTPTSHLDNAVVKDNSRLQIMMAIRGHDFGDKETLCLTYNTLVKPVIEYLAPVWFPIVGPEATSV